MKKKKLLILVILGLALLVEAQSKPVVLRFQDPGSIYSNLVFNIYSTTNLALPTNQWPLLLSMPYNSFSKTNVTGTNWLQTSINLTPDNYFFTANWTNSFWSLQSFFSNGAATPPLLSNTFPFNLTVVIP